MGRIAIGESLYEEVWSHLAGARYEGFAFLLCRTLSAGDGPVFTVEETELIDNAEVLDDGDGWAVSDRALDRVINRAAATDLAIVEVHNHRFGPPAFSPTDREGLEPFAIYVLESLPGRPYAATVWANEAVTGEWFAHRSGELVRGDIKSIAVIGKQLGQVAHSSEAHGSSAERFDRQIPLLGSRGQKTLEQLRIAIVGLGGTGSHVTQALTYLGAKELVLIDPDQVEESNLNRLVTAGRADLGSPKTISARRAVRSINPDIRVEVIDEPLESEGPAADALAGVDLIFGCVDDDGPRLLLNRIALASAIPYFDIATGIILEDPEKPTIGGRLAVTLPGGPCLVCTEELDVEEVRAYFLSSDDREEFIRRGYVSGGEEQSPAVISLNGVIAHVAVNELVLWLAGTRPPVVRADLDVIGEPSAPGPRLLPRRHVARNPGCAECAGVRNWGGLPDGVTKANRAS